MRSLLRLLLVSLMTIAFVSFAASGAEAGSKRPAQRTGYEVGQVAPDLAMVTAAGKTLKLSQLRGSYVVLDLSTLWCGPSGLAAGAVRDEVSALNAPGALDAPVSWVTAELEGTDSISGAAPEPGGLVRFAVEHGIGDLRSPVVSFGPLGSSTNQAARAQLAQYEIANNLASQGTNAFPTFVVLNPNGVILDVFEGFTADESAPPTTSDRVGAALGAQPVPYELREAPYSDPTFSPFTVEMAMDGTSGSATVLPGFGNAPAAFGSLPLAVLGSTSMVGAGYNYVGLSFFFTLTPAEDGRISPMPLESTFEFQQRGVTWTPSPFKKLVPTDSLPLQLVVVPAGSDSGTQHIVTTQTSMDTRGHVGPVTLQQLVDQARDQIDGWGLGDVDVLAVNVPSTWTSPISPLFGLT